MYRGEERVDMNPLFCYNKAIERRRNTMNYKVERSPKLSKMGDPRYIVIDAESGLVLDDAQGYGYKTVKNAHRGYAYQRRTPEERAQHVAKMERVKSWIKQHEDIETRVEIDSWDSIHDREPFNLDGKYITKVLIDLNISLDDVDFTAADIAKVVNYLTTSS